MPRRPPALRRPLTDEERAQLDTPAMRRFVHQVAGRVAGRVPRQVERADLEAETWLGLVEALPRWDPAIGQARGASQATYLRFRAYGQLIDALRAEDMLPRRARAEARRGERHHAIEQLRHGSGDPVDLRLWREAETAAVAWHPGLRDEDGPDRDAQLVAVLPWLGLTPPWDAEAVAPYRSLLTWLHRVGLWDLAARRWLAVETTRALRDRLPRQITRQSSS